MPMLDEARRRIRDYFSHDEQITVRPAIAIQEIAANLSSMTAKERSRNVEHIKAYADLYYQGRHNENVPGDVREQLRFLERRTERLNTVDAARAIVEMYGGPPSRETVIESLERSEKERSRDRSVKAPEIIAQARPVPNRSRENEMEIAGR